MEAPASLEVPAAAIPLQHGHLFTGLASLYSYNLVKNTTNMCGHAAIASIWDFFGRNPYKLPRNVITPDGRAHFNNEALVGRIQHQYPPHGHPE